ncbi:hypothetical protein QFC21_003285 [Naganishia friedmannii]|uniref:Uncharacterized protein n=1 Tax=Naganishia friedmannii TaxID=89922 RepID=A0ACC2VQ87_9TREE|nr:hypothetical protein QFC21_003285 [Naganishia friedmannii]
MYERGRTDGRRSPPTDYGRTQPPNSSDESDEEESNGPPPASDHPGGPGAPSLSLSRNSPSGGQETPSGGQENNPSLFSTVVTGNSRPGTTNSESETWALMRAEWQAQEQQQQDRRGAASKEASSSSPPATLWDVKQLIRYSINMVQASLDDLETRCEEAVNALDSKTERVTTKCQELEQSFQKLQHEMGEQERRHSADLKAIKEQLSEKQTASTANLVQQARGVIEELQEEVAKLKAKDRKKAKEIIVGKKQRLQEAESEEDGGKGGKFPPFLSPDHQFLPTQMTFTSISNSWNSLAETDPFFCPASMLN